MASTTNTSGAIARITKEIGHLQKGNDLSLAVACRDSDVRHVRALIIGPPETPYEYGFFEFEVKFGKEYPIKAPAVRCITTNGGQCRFNPNIYNEGKVCLSILGTWRGQSGEEWSSAQGLESVLLSIQSLMSSNPYENEPGYETAKKEEELPKAYVAKIRHETLRIAVIQRLELLLGIKPEKGEPVKKRSKTGGNDDEEDYFDPDTPPNEEQIIGAGTPATDSSAYEYDAEAAYNALANEDWDPYADMVKRRFLWYYDTYVQTIDKYSQEQTEGMHFQRMVFEYPPNSMEGRFQYKRLRKRLDAIRTALDTELTTWHAAGALQVTQSTQIATQLAFQHAQLQHTWHSPTHPSATRLELSLPNAQNPFTWHITLFGGPSTALSDGVFNLTLHLSPNFPTEQPRVVFQTPIAHHSVSSAGVLCYFPSRPDDLATHLEGIVAAVDDERPVFDPRAVVNPSLFKLFWEGEEGRKKYKRGLRRSAQDSMEF